MVRRWSRINISNFASHEEYSVFGGVQHLKTFRVTTHFKRFYFGFTKHRRRKAARKNRLSFLVPQLNVIGLWSQEYRFFRHTIKFTYTSNIFLNNYSVHNHVMYANKDMLSKNHFELFITASTSLRIINYYASKNINTFTLNKSMQFSLLHILSTPNPRLAASWNLEDKTLSLVGMAYQTNTYPLTPSSNESSKAITTLYDSYFYVHTTYLITIYRILVLLYLQNVNNY